MKFFLFLAIFGLVESFKYQASPNGIIETLFTRWQTKYNFSYDNLDQRIEAMKTFRKILGFVLCQQLKYFSRRSSWRMKVNKFSVEFDKIFLNGGQFPDKIDDFSTDTTVAPRAFNLPVYPAPPESLDYRSMGFVTPVQDQGYKCASCYAFAAACGIEGQIAKNNGSPVIVSAQNIVDCSKSVGNQGCKGGSIAYAYKYILQNGGSEADYSYPYVGSTQTCAYNSSESATNISAYTYVTGDENYLKSVLAAIGPLPVGMKGSVLSFYYYSSGIYDDPLCTTRIDHAVCLVGYGTDNSTTPPTDYWIVKNSWSTDWGDNGYFKLKMGSNLCGIRNYVVYPTL